MGVCNMILSFYEAKIFFSIRTLSTLLHFWSNSLCLQGSISTTYLTFCNAVGCRARLAFHH